jgi:hypothetical protein
VSKPRLSSVNTEGWRAEEAGSASIGYYHYATYHHLGNGMDILSCADMVNEDTFYNYLAKEYDASKPIIRFTSVDVDQLEGKKD